MGSSSKPAKRNDRPIIPTPHKKGSGAGSGGGQETVDLNQTCPVYFDVKLTQNPLLRIGNPLHIDDKGKVLLDRHEVGILTTQQFQKIIRCQKYGYIYMGRVGADKNKILYGRFERTTI